MSSVILFHHALGLTPGVEAFADELRSAGHTVSLPDLFDGETFTSLDEGVGHVDLVGIEALLAAGAGHAPNDSTPTVYGGFSLGALIAHKLAQAHPNAEGALLYHYGDVPMTLFGDSWPAPVPVQFHISEHDEWREAGVVEGFVEAVEPFAPVQLFEYRGAAHLFTDSTSIDFDPEASALVVERTNAFLSNLN
jgi:dienelactone hydrolase